MSVRRLTQTRIYCPHFIASKLSGNIVGPSNLLGGYFHELEVAHEDWWRKALMLDHPLWHDMGSWVIYTDVCNSNAKCFYSIANKYVEGKMSENELREMIEKRIKYVVDDKPGL